ncbi:CrcB family protein [Rhodococcus sp. BP-349]|uniref:fluoride efflux transporter FluC n=1 Tax=unclassified Rhodococcus (in: high G+C Gram-positive bacteria) TaxID=192944 RepID=UPI001C9A8FD8|nr:MULTISPECIES: CrcB family protein [unclassified Rhodococcus (in: high G+C Gram-positive bacteria)]MBY6538905.1 CrcB family protein [Rhodococcus sp. BP-363]MBY6543242.1 CrcB family protein [Rhodococcus sp. BP-369]MBY6562472.1 CrcB family protein [Rhodococcus sp. BP-370]MBY6576764.1 CrcB family protein [Rhodococcus sp. BP-364]MBY6586065.1 CrcB family protein [Rhodococcus sp. BP-358]
MTLAAVLLAGALGAVVRSVVDGEVTARLGRPSPLGTLFVNVSGSFLLGVLAGLVLFAGRPAEWQAVAGTGFCGGYTTFSTASVQSVRLVQEGRHRAAAANVGITVIASVVACAGGLALVWAASGGSSV